MFYVILPKGPQYLWTHDLIPHLLYSKDSFQIVQFCCTRKGIIKAHLIFHLYFCDLESILIKYFCYCFRFKSIYCRYLKFDINNFVETNRKIKWCPGPTCERAVKLPDCEVGSTDISSKK